MFCVTVPIGESVECFRFKMGAAIRVASVHVTDYAECQVEGMQKADGYDDREAPRVDGEFVPDSPVAVNLFGVCNRSVRIAIDAPEEILVLRSVVNARGHIPRAAPRLAGRLGDYLAAVLHPRAVRLVAESRPALLSALRVSIESEYAREFLLRWLTFRFAAGPDLTLVKSASLISEVFSELKIG